MNKLIIFISLITLMPLFAKDIELDVRATYVNYDYDKGFPDAEVFATSLKIKYDKELLENLHIGLAFATVQDLGILDYDASLKKRNMAYIFDKNKENFSLLHQAYFNYSYSKSFIEIGRVELETPLISPSDSFVLSNSFEGIHLKISEFEDYTLRVGYISKMSGSWDSAYDGANFESMTRQAWAHRADNGNEKYYNLVDDLNVSEAGMTFVGLEYEKDTLSIMVYNHILLDAYTSLFGEIDYTFQMPNDAELLIAAQYIQYDGIGSLANNSNSDAVVDYATYSVKTEFSSEALKLELAYTGISDTPSLHFFGTAGGYPEFASGGMVNYFETSLRDTDIFSISPSFNLTHNKNEYELSILYSYYNLNSTYTKNGIIGDSINGDDYMHAYGFSAKYSFDKKLSWLVKLAQRRLEHGDKNLLFRTILGYKF